jgi:SAM-dependent methyltransferase
VGVDALTSREIQKIQMNDIVTNLEPEALARHLGNPEGEVGIAVADRLNRMNAKVYAQAYQAIRLADSHRVLEIGFGNGHLIPELLSLAKEVKYAGIDISPTMVEEASAFNAIRIAAGLVEIKLGSSASIPYADATFDSALALNTLYFWDNPSADLAEIRRVLKPGGKLILGAIDPSSTGTNPVFRHGFRFYEAEEIRAMLGVVGFADIGIEILQELRKRPDGTEYHTEYMIISAV